MIAEVNKIYVVEDDKNTRRIFELTAKSVQGEVECFDAAEDALRATQANTPDLLITDFQLLGEMNGLDLIKAVHETVSKEVPIILVSGMGSVAGAFEELLSDEEYVRFLPKPFSTRDLAQVMRDLLRHDVVEEND